MFHYTTIRSDGILPPSHAITAYCILHTADAVAITVHYVVLIYAITEIIDQRGLVESIIVISFDGEEKS